MIGILKKFSGGFLTLALCAVCVVPAYANNHADCPLPNYYISTSTYANTDFGDKYDASYHYIYNQCAIQVRAISYSPTNANCTKSGSAAIPANSRRFITNYVYEYGYRKCKLTIRSDISGATATLKGFWSPDSIGSYTVANP